jgi:hypothetical protein
MVIFTRYVQAKGSRMIVPINMRKKRNVLGEISTRVILVIGAEAPQMRFATRIIVHG